MIRVMNITELIENFASALSPREGILTDKIISILSCKEWNNLQPYIFP